MRFWDNACRNQQTSTLWHVWIMLTYNFCVPYPCKRCKKVHNHVLSHTDSGPSCAYESHGYEAHGYDAFHSHLATSPRHAQPCASGTCASEPWHRSALAQKRMSQKRIVPEAHGPEAHWPRSALAQNQHFTYYLWNLIFCAFGLKNAYLLQFKMFLE